MNKFPLSSKHTYLYINTLKYFNMYVHLEIQINIWKTKNKFNSKIKQIETKCINENT